MTSSRAGAPTVRPPAPDRASLRGRSRRNKEQQRTGLVLISPTLIVVLTLVVLPILWTVLLAFQRVRLLQLRNVGIFGTYTVGSGGAILLGLVAAMALRRPFPGRGFVRAAMLLPYVAPVVAVTFVWKTALNAQFGIVNVWGRALGWDEPIAFLSQRSLGITILGLDIDVPIALVTVIAFEWWRSFPFAFLFLMARLNAVPDVLEEAARVDGATPIQRFFYIVLPQLMPTLAVLSVLRFIWTFNSFDDIWLLTGGGAGTGVVAVRVYDFLIARGDIGAASAQALALAAILALSVGILLKRFGAKEIQA